MSRRYPLLLSAGLAMLLVTGCGGSDDAGNQIAGSVEATSEDAATAMPDVQTTNACEVVSAAAVNELRESIFGSPLSLTGRVDPDPYFEPGQCNFTAPGSDDNVAIAYLSPGSVCGDVDSSGVPTGVEIGPPESPITVNDSYGCRLVDVDLRLIVRFYGLVPARSPQADAAWIRFYNQVST